MTRQTFSKHLALLCTPGVDPYSFDFTKSLPSGFCNTGIYLFSPPIIRDTVMKPVEEPSILQKDSAPMQLIAGILKDSMHANNEKTDACLESIADILSDHQYLAKTIRAAAEKLIIAPKPKKQRRLKDQRLALDKGVLCLESDFVSGMRDNVAAKTAVAEAKKLATAKAKKAKVKAPRAKKIPTEAQQPKKPSKIPTQRKKAVEKASKTF